MNVPRLTYVVAIAAALVVFAPLFGAPVPPWATSIAVAIAGLSLVVRAMWYQGRRTFVRPARTRAVYDSDGWRKDPFVMEGLEADGEALRDCTAEAAEHGYRREPGSDQHEWRFVREPARQ